MSVSASFHRRTCIMTADMLWYQCASETCSRSELTTSSRYTRGSSKRRRMAGTQPQSPFSRFESYAIAVIHTSTQAVAFYGPITCRFSRSATVKPRLGRRRRRRKLRGSFRRSGPFSSFGPASHAWAIRPLFRPLTPPHPAKCSLRPILSRFSERDAIAQACDTRPRGRGQQFLASRQPVPGGK